MLRKFGVEIEAFGVPRHTLVLSLEQAGIPVTDYHGAMAHAWTLKGDASIQGPQSFELVSPILEGDQALEQVRTVCHVLTSLNAQVNSSCGLHVHHDARDMDLFSWKKLLGLYVNYESALDALMPESRRGNQNYYCRSTRLWGDINASTDAIMACETPGQLINLYACRYYKLNFYAFHAHGSIEFRHHSGTVNADKIINWIQLTGMMIDKARSAHHVLIQDYDDPAWKFRRLMTNLPTTAAMKKFYQKRFTQLTQGIDTAA